jgi:hypothetical protein
MQTNCFILAESLLASNAFNPRETAPQYAQERLCNLLAAGEEGCASGLAAYDVAH